MGTPGPPGLLCSGGSPYVLIGRTRSGSAAAGAEPGPTQTLVEWNTYGSVKSRFSDSLMLTARSSDGGLVLYPGRQWYASLPQLSAGASTAFLVSPKSPPGQRQLGYSGSLGWEPAAARRVIKNGNLADSSEKPA